MATGIRFPIRYKILAVLSAVVIAAVSFYLVLASSIFHEDKTVLIYELNQANVRTLAADVETTIKRVLDKLRLVAALSASGDSATIASALAGEDELVKVAILAIRDSREKDPLRKFVQTWPAYLATYGKKPAYLDQMRDAVPVPFEKVQALGVWVRNATPPGEGNPPLMTIATTIERASALPPRDPAERQVIYADVRLDRLLETFSSTGIARAYAVDSERHVLAHADHSLVAGGASLESDALVNASAESKVRSGVRRFDEGDTSYLGSYSQVGLAGVVVASKVETGEAFEAARRLIRKSLIYAMIVVTAAVLISLFFSHSLTAPIQRLVDATQRIAQGDFTGLIQVGSRDELAVLADSFNSMTADLRISRAQIEEYSRDLERKVQDRTARLEAQNVAIKEAQEALVRTTRLASVGEIAGRAAHEVLNPLTNVVARLEKIQVGAQKADREDLTLLGEITGAWASALKHKGKDRLFEELAVPSRTQAGRTLLEEDLENLGAIASDLGRRVDERDRDVEFLLRESGRINKIVNGMRSLTRVSGNRRPIKIHGLLDEVLGTMADVLRKRRVQTETRYSASSPRVLADHDELIQVLSNCLRNSMQAIESAQRESKPGRVGDPARVWLATSVAERDGGRWVEIRVGDNGPGIPERDFERIFDPSFTTKTADEGTGLGLSISRRFIRAFDGEITVERSRAGVETVFLIELPEDHGRGESA